MKKEAWKIMFACALGAGIGSFIMLEISIYFIWVGLIVGGLVGYLSYNFRKVLAAIPAAYRAAKGWRPPPHARKVLVEIGWILLLLFNIITLVFVMAALASLAVFHITQDTGYSLAILFVWFISTYSYYTIISINAEERERESRREGRKGLDRDESCRQLIWKICPPIVFFWHLPRGIWWVVKRIPSAIVATACFIKNFGWQMFIRIHSQKRLICGTDALIGAAVGYAAGSALIGALAGALIGLVNYELVTRRWLIPKGYVKAPVPAKS